MNYDAINAAHADIVRVEQALLESKAPKTSIQTEAGLLSWDSTSNDKWILWLNGKALRGCSAEERIRVRPSLLHLASKALASN